MQPLRRWWDLLSSRLNKLSFPQLHCSRTPCPGPQHFLNWAATQPGTLCLPNCRGFHTTKGAELSLHPLLISEVSCWISPPHSLGPLIWMAVLPSSVLAATPGLVSSTDLNRVFHICSSKSLIKIPSRSGARKVSWRISQKPDFQVQHESFTTILQAWWSVSSPICLSASFWHLYHNVPAWTHRSCRTAYWIPLQGRWLLLPSTCPPDLSSVEYYNVILLFCQKRWKIVSKNFIIKKKSRHKEAHIPWP